MTTLPNVNYKLLTQLKESRAEALERSEHLVGCIEAAYESLHRAKLGGTVQDQERCKDEIDHWTSQKEAADKEYFELLDQEKHWAQLYRSTHVHWVRAQEELGVPIHHVFLTHGPSHPPSYILYDDEGNLIFQRDSSNRYTSFTFWLENLTHPNPIETLGIDYYSSRELRIRPALLKELYELETFYLKGDMSALERIQEIRAIIRAGYVLYKIEKPN